VSDVRRNDSVRQSDQRSDGFEARKDMRCSWIDVSAATSPWTLLMACFNNVIVLVHEAVCERLRPGMASLQAWAIHCWR